MQLLEDSLDDSFDKWDHTVTNCMVVMLHKIKKEVEIELDVDFQSALIDSYHEFGEFWFQSWN